MKILLTILRYVGMWIKELIASPQVQQSITMAQFDAMCNNGEFFCKITYKGDTNSEIKLCNHKPVNKGQMFVILTRRKAIVVLSRGEKSSTIVRLSRRNYIEIRSYTITRIQYVQGPYDYSVILAKGQRQ